MGPPGGCESRTVTGNTRPWPCAPGTQSTPRLMVVVPGIVARQEIGGLACGFIGIYFSHRRDRT